MRSLSQRDQLHLNSTQPVVEIVYGEPNPPNNNGGFRWWMVAWLVFVLAIIVAFVDCTPGQAIAGASWFDKIFRGACQTYEQVRPQLAPMLSDNNDAGHE